MVRAGNNNELADLVEENSAVAIGWDNMGDVPNLETREQLKAMAPLRKTWMSAE